jgi:hypothetical protein
MRVLVMGGMHGNEPLGLNLVKLFQERPVKNVSTIFANEPAIKAQCRFMSQDLNRSFPGDVKSDGYESKRAAQLLILAQQYDIVLDFHNTYCPDNDCGFVGAGASQKLFYAAWLLGIDKVIVADYDCINKYSNKCLSIEISLGGRLNVPKIWYEQIKALSKLDSFKVTPSIKKYRFVYRMTLEDKEKLGLPSKNLKAFKPLDKKLAQCMGVKSPAFPIFIDDKYTPYSYGGVLNEF